MKNTTLPILFLLAFWSACTSDKTTQTWFTALGEKETGIVFNNVNVENENINILTYEYLYNGGGVAVGDVNNDGLPDLYFTSNNRENKLFLNKGGFKFEDITAIAGVGAKGWKTGTTMADVNADGLLDIYVCRSADGNPANRRNLLFINNGGPTPTFTEKAAEYGIDDDSYTTQAVFFDMDKDGDLDLFTLNHSLISISNKVGIDPVARTARQAYLSNRLFRNDSGKFTDISDEAAVSGGISNYGLSVMAVDFNNDGWTDIYVTNDYAEHDHLYINQQGKSFTDVIETATGHVPHFSMGSDAADINRDGLVDFFAGDMLPEDNKRQKLLYGPHQYDQFQIMLRNQLHYQYMRNMLQLNNGDGTFSEIGQLAGVSNTDWSWATLLADYDNDGWNDLFITNGYKRDFTNMDFLKYREDVEQKLSMGSKPAGGLAEVIKKMPSNKVHNYMFRNQGERGGRFEDVSESWGFGLPVLSNGAAYADLDNDGDLDLVVNNMDEQAGVFRNNAEKLAPQRKSIRFKLKGNAPNTQGIGAKIRLYQGIHIDERELQPVRGFQSNVDFVLHFGLGENPDIDSAYVIWPSGKSQKLNNLTPGSLVQVKESEANTPWKNSTSAQPTYFKQISPAPIPFEHREDDVVDFNLQTTLPCFESRQGPRLVSGDVNGDQRIDFFLPGAKGQASALWLQQSNGQFKKNSQPVFETWKNQEFVDGVLTDLDGDGDADLVAVAGGYAFDDQPGNYQPRIAMNDGKGTFSETANALSALSINASVVKAADVDDDGDQDLFIGARSVPKKYPIAQPSALLLNDGKGGFTNVAPAWLPQNGDLGLISDAVWCDVNGDKRPDLITAGQYTPVRFLLNTGNKFTDETASRAPAKAEGWWLRLHAADVDGDGDQDLIAGNWGMNNQIKADEKHPAQLVFKDFDGNGSVDPILGHTIQGKLYPSYSLDELLSQLPGQKKRFPNYESYSTVDFEALLTGDFAKDATKLPVNRFETTLFINDGAGKFSYAQLPLEAQFSPVYAIAVSDVNHDGRADMILAGNQSTTRISMGKMDANYGILFLGKGDGKFEYVPQYKSGLRMTGDVKDLFLLPDGRLFAARNNAGIAGYETTER